MKFTTTIAIAAIATTMIGAGTAQAQDCAAPDGDRFDYSDEQVQTLYDCIKDLMAEQYASGENEVAGTFREWSVTSTRPAVAGPHGNRFLQTFANDVAAEQYLKFEEEGFTMPAGAMLAKESFNIKDGEAVVGPLFIMEKVAEGEAPDAQDWVYSAVQPNGKPMGIKQSFCADCHLGWDYRDSLAYPVEDVRLTTAN